MNPISVYLFLAPDRGAPDLAADFAAAGFTVRGSADGANLVRDTLRAAPDVVACWAPRPEPALFEAVAALQAQQHVPLLVFTADTDVEAMQRALDAGVHAWVVQGYDARRLRPLVQLAQARAAHERELRGRIAQLAERLEERKWVDRAKGILMRAQHLDEDAAFRLLRTVAMQGKQRVGSLSRHVIEAARIAQAINRAGQQRMLSQRLVKLYALACSGTDARAAALLLRASMQRVEENLASLQADLAPATFGDLVGAAQARWAAMRRVLEAAPARTEIAALDREADALQAQAEALVLALESCGDAAGVQVVNVAGRQRMLSQRAAKLALLQALDVGAEPAALAQTAGAFERGLATLAAAPLCTSGIRALLDREAAAWQELQAAVREAGTPAGRLALAAASESLLEACDALTAAYEQSLQVLLAG